MSDIRIATQALLQGMNYLIQEQISKAPIDKTFDAIISSVKEDNIYDVKVDNHIYTNIPSMFKGLSLNDTVKVKVPQGQYSQMYIEGKYNMEIANIVRDKDTFTYSNTL